MKLKLIQNNLCEMLGESTSYGLPRIFKSKRIFFKFFWLTFFITGCIASFYFVIEATNNYLKYEAIQKIEYVYLNQMPFPAITICPWNMSPFIFNKSFVEIFQDQDCYFNGIDCKLNAEKYFIKFTSVYFGDCLLFNSGKNMSGNSIPILNITKVGNFNGFYMSFKNISIRIWISDQSLIPFINGFELKRESDSFLKNTFSLLPLSLSKKIRLGLPYNQCLKFLNEFHLNKTVLNFIQSKIGGGYEQRHCYDFCQNSELMQKYQCNCTNRLDENCQNFCPFECDSISYSTVALSYEKPDCSSFSIYYDEFKYTLYSEMPKTEIFDFISNIGGILGLFIGSSFVTLFELGELLIEISFILTTKNEVNKREEETAILKQEINRLKNEMNKIKNEIELLDNFIRF